MDDFAIDLGTVTSNDCIPSGDYAVQCVGVDLKNTKDGAGQYLVTQFEVLSGDHRGRRVFTNFNIKNRNQQAVDIALRSIKQWVQAAGGTGSEQLTMGLLQNMMGKEVFANVGIEQDKTGQYEPKNTIKRFHVQQRAAAPIMAVPGVAMRAPASAAAPVSNKQPWER